MNRREAGTDGAVTELVDRLLDLVLGLAPDHPSIAVEPLQQAIDAWRTALRQLPDPWKLESTAARVIACCEQFLGRLRGLEGAREAEVGEIVTMLRDVLSTLRGDAQAFDEGFAQSASRFASIGAIEDIRELRKALSHEVGALKKLVTDRKAQEDVAYSNLSRRVESLEANLREARDEAAKDGLTGVVNRRSFDRALARLVARAKDGKFSFTLAMVDVDDFKNINDVHGHPIGDRVLICVARLLSENTRSSDVVARYGGEEFALLLEQATAAQARGKLQALIDGVAKSYTYDHEGQPRSVQFTFSIGATDYQPGDAGDDLIKRADAALYQAKRKGKRRLEVSTPTLLRRLLS